MNILRRGWGIAKRMWKPHENNEQGAVRGAAFVFLSRFFIKAVYFARTIVLARLLFPDDFGLFGMAVAVIGITDLFQPGFNAALIHEKGDVKKYLNSIWSFNILRTGMFAALLVLIAPLAGTYFENDTVTQLVRALALGVFIMGFESVGPVLFQKEFNFKKKLFFEMSYTSAEVIVSILLALYMQNPWVLVGGVIANRIAAVIASFAFHPFRPKWELDFKLIRELFSYGKWLMFATLLGFFSSKIDVFAIGKVLDESSVGYFQLAFGLAMLPSIEIARVLGTIVFPYASKVQTDSGRLRALFSKTLGLVMALMLPTIAGFAVFGEAFVGAVYGERWVPMTGIIEVLIVVGCVRAFEYLTNPIALGVGRPDIPTKTLAVQAVVMGVSIVPLISAFGILGAAYAWLLSIFCARFTGLVMLFGQVGQMWREVLRAFVLPGIASFFLWFIAQELTFLLPPSGAVILIFEIFFSVVIYGAMLVALDFLFGKRLINSFLWIRNHS